MKQLTKSQEDTLLSMYHAGLFDLFDDRPEYTFSSDGLLHGSEESLNELGESGLLIRNPFTRKVYLNLRGCDVAKALLLSPSQKALVLQLKTFGKPFNLAEIWGFSEDTLESNLNALLKIRMAYQLGDNTYRLTSLADYISSLSVSSFAVFMFENKHTIDDELEVRDELFCINDNSSTRINWLDSYEAGLITLPNAINDMISNGFLDIMDSVGLSADYLWLTHKGIELALASGAKRKGYR